MPCLASVHLHQTSRLRILSTSPWLRIHITPGPRLYSVSFRCRRLYLHSEDSLVNVGETDDWQIRHTRALLPTRPRGWPVGCLSRNLSGIYTTSSNPDQNHLEYVRPSGGVVLDVWLSCPLYTSHRDLAQSTWCTFLPALWSIVPARAARPPACTTDNVCDVDCTLCNTRSADMHDGTMTTNESSLLSILFSSPLDPFSALSTDAMCTRS